MIYKQPRSHEKLLDLCLCDNFYTAMHLWTSWVGSRDSTRLAGDLVPSGPIIIPPRYDQPKLRIWGIEHDALLTYFATQRHGISFSGQE